MRSEKKDTLGISFSMPIKIVHLIRNGINGQVFLRVLMPGAFCCLFLSTFAFVSSPAQAQDTVRVTLDQFISRGLEQSQEIDAARQEVALAENDISQVQDQRFLPTFNLQTMHGLVPKVDNDVATEGAFLDDLSNLTPTTEANLQLIQPVYTWGALRNAVKASESAAEAAESKFRITKEETELRLYNLYQSYLLSLEVQRLLDEAQNQIDRVEETLNDTTGSESEIDQSELFKFEVFKSEFAIRAAEVDENRAFVQRVWNFVLQADEQTVYMPEERFLDPVQNKLETVGYYKSAAVDRRPEINALESAIRAAEYGLEATKSQKYPALFAGLSATYLNTPNPPVGNYSFRLNDTNYASAALGVGFRQNLDFFSLRTDVNEREIQRRQAQFSKDAAVQGIILQINEKYKDASLAKIKIEKTDDALSTARKWVRQEQLDYDFDIGDPKDLIDAIKKELQLKVQHKQFIFNFNKDMAELFNSSSLPVISLTTNYSDDE